MKKVLLISSLYHPHIGGVETMIREMARAYQKRGISVSILTKRWPNHLKSHEIYESVDIYRITNAKTPKEFEEVVAWIKENHHAIKADVIHVIGMRRPLPLIALLLSKYWQVPLICTVAGGDIPDSHDPYPGSVWNESKATVYEAFKGCDALTCVSKALANDFKTFFPEIKTDSVKVLYAGIDLEFIKRIPREKLFDKYIISLRRLDPTKGIDLLIRAFDLIKQAYPDVHLVIAGEGPEEARLKKLMKELGLSTRVHFIGSVDLRRAIALLRGAVMTVVPSLSEAGGLINVEAQAAECPVVASNVGGIPEYVSEGGGLLFKSGDIADLSDKITRILDDEKLASRLIKNGVNHSKKFDWNSIILEYLSLYEECINTYKIAGIKKPFEDSTLVGVLWEQLVS